MCVLALWVGASPVAPLIVAANRDELYERAASPPSEVEPGIVAGRDQQSGGTWLGVSRHGLFVAVTNRRDPARTPESYSRGLVALEVLRCQTLGAVEALVGRLTSQRPIAGFSLVAVSGTEGLCLHWTGGLTATPFGRGVHVVSNDRDLDDPTMPEKNALDAFCARAPGLLDAGTLAGFLRSHEGERPICKHGDRHGTVSSTIYIGEPGAPRLFYSAGPPCRTEFVDYSRLLSRAPALTAAEVPGES
jgi:hypothetical protein